MNQVRQHGLAPGRFRIYEAQNIGKGIEEEVRLDLGLQKSQFGFKGLFLAGEALDPLFLNDAITGS